MRTPESLKSKIKGVSRSVLWNHREIWNPPEYWRVFHTLDTSPQLTPQPLAGGLTTAVEWCYIIFSSVKNRFISADQELKTSYAGCVTLSQELVPLLSRDATGRVLQNKKLRCVLNQYRMQLVTYFQRPRSFPHTKNRALQCICK